MALCTGYAGPGRCNELDPPVANGGSSILIEAVGDAVECIGCGFLEPLGYPGDLGITLGSRPQVGHYIGEFSKSLGLELLPLRLPVPGLELGGDLRALSEHVRNGLADCNGLLGLSLGCKGNPPGGRPGCGDSGHYVGGLPNG